MRDLMEDSSCKLERITKADLQLAPAVLCHNSAKGSSSGVRLQAATGFATPIRMVNPVESFKAENERLSLCRMEGLEETGAPVLETGLEEDVPTPLVAESTRCRRQDVYSGLERIPLPLVPEQPRLRNFAVHNVSRCHSAAVSAARSHSSDVL